MARSRALLSYEIRSGGSSGGTKGRFRGGFTSEKRDGVGTLLSEGKRGGIGGGGSIAFLGLLEMEEFLGLLIIEVRSGG